MSEQTGDFDSSKKTENEKDDSSSLDGVQINSIDLSPRCWIEVLPSNIGVLLCAVLVNVMTEGLTPSQENILGNFISSIGSLISYKASRNDLDTQ
jgi:hypothetical protein